MVAAYRAVESKSAKPLFKDPYAAALAGPILDSPGFQPGSAAGGAASDAVRGVFDGSMLDRFAIRTRYVDDALKAAVAAGARQVVILGAGFDSRAWRLDAPGGGGRKPRAVYELDFARALAVPDEALAAGAAAGSYPRPIVKLAESRVAVPVDLASPTWPSQLLAAGFDKRLPTVWLMEGLSQYLEPDAVKALVFCVGELSAPKSR